MDSSTDEEPEAPARLIATLDQGRQQFLALVAHIRPELHRYCTRMTGSPADGEDVVQDTLARAYYELSQMAEMPPLRPWLFRIAHNRAIDHHRRESYRQTDPLDAANDMPADAALSPDERLARDQAVRAAVDAFLALPPSQRACVILKDVLDHSLEDIADELQMSVAAVKAALHRGRASLRERVADAAPAPREASPALAQYTQMFNTQDWDGIRTMLADDVRLDLVGRRRLRGRKQVENYFGNYARIGGWRMAPGWLHDREVLAVFDGAAPHPHYFIELVWTACGRLAEIRDYRYVDYIAQDGVIELAVQVGH
jgi:RNA polymerase sigma factor (sigma-70 family)